LNELRLLKRRVKAKIRLATTLMWICGFLTAVPFVHVVYRLAIASNVSGNDDEYLAVVSYFFNWGVVFLLFPLLGASFALNWRRDLQNQTDQSTDRDSKDEGNWETNTSS